jgi:acetoacetyl-CoA synthetase
MSNKETQSPESPATATSLSDAVPDPSPIVSRSNQMGAFARWVANQGHVPVQEYSDLWRWSVEHPAAFWEALRLFLDIPMSGGTDAVLSGAMPNARWFAGATTNFANMPTDPALLTQPALVGVTEAGLVAELTHAEFRRQAASFAEVLQELGVEPGDRVVAYMPNIVETIIALYATASIGAVWASVGADYEPDAAVARLGQLSPKVLIGTDGYRFRGRDLDRTAKLRSVFDAVGAEQLVLVSTIGLQVDGAIQWANCVDRDRTYQPVQMPFDHPLWVLFSSGTTGAPKGIVHGHGGAQLEQHKSLALHLNIGPGSRLLWATSPSWVVWNTLASAVLRGACSVTFEGSPTHPDPGALWKVVADQAVTEFGTSPAFLAATERSGVVPAHDYDLSAVRTLISTGSPLAQSTSRWALEAIGETRPLVSVSGGTDVIGPFAGGVPGDRVVPGEIQARCLGVSLEAWREVGVSVVDEVGELVITQPMPSMPLHFWNDPDGSKLREAYFETYPGVWRHGDWITVTDRGTVIVHGRSDSTLNRNGIRMGSSDIYQALEFVPDVEDSLVIGAELGDGKYWMPLFVALRAGRVLDQDLQDAIKSAIRSGASPRHVPDEVIQVPAIPRTRTGKRLEVPVKRILQGADVDDVVSRSAIEDPTLLDYYQQLASDRAAADSAPD